VVFPYIFRHADLESCAVGTTSLLVQQKFRVARTPAHPPIAVSQSFLGKPPVGGSDLVF
jgi:hypothetical protein